MIDPQAEPPIPLMQVPLLPWLPRRRGGRKLHIATAFRWAQRGLRGVKLEIIQIGGTKCTSEEALKRYFARLSGEATAPPPTKARQRQVAAAERELATAGMM